MPRALRLLPVLLTLLCSAVLPGAAHASATQDGIFQDDNLLIFAPPAEVAKTMDQIKALGADRLRVSVFWKNIAPDNESKTRPDFDATDPAAYPEGAWEDYDTLVRLATDRGLAITFNPTSPAPYWATGTPNRADIEKNYTPDPKEFEKFVTALATRYSGSYVPPPPPSATPPPQTTTTTDPTLPPVFDGRAAAVPRQSTGAQVAGALPRVSFWTIWNEPNQPGWLTPQWATDPRDTSKFLEAAPLLYRGLFDAAYAALVATGHGNDTILVGETAPKGNDTPTKDDARASTRQIKPGVFIRQLYCLDTNLNPLEGTTASIRGCPVSDQVDKFPAQHPGLFKASGYAHHPYEMTFSPSTRRPDSNNFTTANIADLSLMLKRIWGRYQQPVPGGGSDVPLWFTEFGEETNPPDLTGVSPATQALYINEAEWLTYRSPSVRSLTQFLLVDSKPMQGVDSDNDRYGGSFQTGLKYLDGTVKPALAAYRLPLFLPSPTVGKGKRLRVFGMARTAKNGAAAKVRIDVRRAGSKTFRKVKTVTASAARGYFVASIVVRASGAVRLSYAGDTSRVAAFTVK